MGGLLDTGPYGPNNWPKAAPDAPYYEKERAAKFDDFARRIQQGQGLGQTSGFIAQAPFACNDRTHVQFCPHCGVCHCGGASLNRDKFGPQPG